jgi:membrane glycosyltransferase
MPWILLLIAIALFMVALSASSMVMVIICVLASLGLSIFAIMALLAQRVGNSTRSETMLIDPQELRRLRELAEAKRAEAAGTPAPSAGDAAQS